MVAHRLLAERRRAVLVDLAIRLGIPFVMAFRACLVSPTASQFSDKLTYNVVLTLLPSAGPTSSISCPPYVVLALRAFLVRPVPVNLTATRYFRLMALASLELVLNLSVATYGLYLTASRSPIAKWVSWDVPRTDFYNVEQAPAMQRRS
ncbi:hypothetical protein K438DRAFT_1992173 [Mycena galopus ATCC 62051]|nr:hypothetical protein K438DRAFT_1992173 [Mycena galopus ATCC 62051]